MYDEILKTSGRYARSNRAFVEAAIAEHEASSQVSESTRVRDFESEGNMVLESVMGRESISARFTSFVQTVRTALVTEAMYKIFKESMSDEIKNDRTSTSIMRAMVTEYVNENGYDTILNRMRTGSSVTSAMYNTIIETATKILESVDKSNPDTFFITPAMKDEFFKQLDYSDSEAISDAIHQRATQAMDDFITANTKDHEDITAALQQAQEKIGSVSAEDDELRESYSMIAKRKATEVRNRPKGVFHSMVTAMCESVMKNHDMHDEFMTEGRLNIDKIVSRTHLMYSFMEMLNTSRIGKVDEAFIENVLRDLSK